MRVALLGLICLACLIETSNANAFREEYETLRASHYDQLPILKEHRASPNRYFVPGMQFEADKTNNFLAAEEYARQLTSLCRKSLSQDPKFAYQLLHEAAYFGSNNDADKIVNPKTRLPQSRRANYPHPRLNWKRRGYFRVTSEHYQITCRDEKQGIEIAKRMELLHAMWRQLFFDCWSNAQRLRSALAAPKKLVPRSTRLHRVVLFPNQSEYADFFKRTQPRIGITNGYYDFAASSSYFFSNTESAHSTQLHEGTHQLFQEVQRVPQLGTMPQNFWLIEGIAMYMESVQNDGLTWTIGGLGSHRLQYARYRWLQERFYIPLEQLNTYGRQRLQQDSEIRRLYSQSAGLTHFLMDANNAQYRNATIHLIQQIYQGRDRSESLSQLTNSTLSNLDSHYQRFLQVDDNKLLSATLNADRLRSLCLGATQVTNAALMQMTQQKSLEWLDLARLPVQRSGLEFMKEAHSLRQVSFDHCAKVGDEVVMLLASFTELEELDLTNTAITDAGLVHLKAHPTLKTLWLAGTHATDSSVALFPTMPALQILSCGQTEITPSGLARLRQLMPQLTIQTD